MASQELRKRLNWQTLSGRLALDTENVFYSALQAALNAVYPNTFIVKQHPVDLKDIYSKHALPDSTLSQIYNVGTFDERGRLYEWGIKMDFSITNIKNNKILFGEIKRQDGWVEGKAPSAGRGNAHERCCKYFTPGLIRALRKLSRIDSSEILPFWIVFVGDITRDPKRNREIDFWFQEYKSNYFMWRNTQDIGSLLDFFENNLLPFLL